MSVTLTARAGKQLSFQVKYWNPDHTELMPVDGYTARIQLRAKQRNGRVLLNSNEYKGTLPAPPGTIMTRLANEGHWRIALGKTMVRSLPASTRFEVELVNDSDSEDVRLLFNGVINVQPEAVSTND